MRRSLPPSLVLLGLLTGCLRTTTWSITEGKDTVDPDADGDGYTVGDGDCDDDDPTIHPGAVELCDGLNNDCDGGIDEDASDGTRYYMDGDGDDFGNEAAQITACNQPPGFILNAGDCDDSDKTTFPGAVEICNDAIDNNCNGDETECVLAGTIPLAEADIILVGEVAGDRFGTHLTGVGDLDGDGLDDVAVGAPKNDARGNDGGAVYIFGGLSEPGVVDASAATGRILAISAGHSVGTAIAPAGDVDGDGYDDLVVGAPRANAGGTDAGEVYLVHGPVVGDVILNSAALRLIGEISYDVAGTSVSGAGDLTGDGVADLLIGATGYGDGGFQNRGAAYVVSGTATGTVDLSDAAARIMGEQRYDRVGTKVAAAGDVNGDGVADLLTSGYTWPSNDGTGAVFLFEGPVAGNLNAVDCDALYEGPASGAQAGFAMATGDLDGDGYLELVVSAPLVTVVDDEEGAVYIINGPLVGDVRLSAADGVISGGVRRDRIGDSVDAGGDLNRDGRGDVIIGGAQADSDAVDQGLAWVFLGPIAGSHSTADANVTLPAEIVRDAAGASVAFAGDTNGDRIADVLVGATANDRGGVDSGAAYLVFGTSW